mmetsp:Transcript_18323/g.31358  ORF Transcript_18323/g.31358 Transcript_18323/m.31358 type:complete len:255 (+) Transcript_18323:65-829(+)|eukprot:CAMPEP_0119101666 /NCGR_PEP_ID=MMETSP1180-20130426/656_1 /TAXON_ID=3052 ORGANISM="Chlamydomonas cf sp, Strain CCMP681" /NCGR_SAMPLE_ID=MMETSP1180 /ASSEMBLY_ACC=CAM_ASM_000741 /LENGTH=254 /DNA_ID=CAMNT_0007085821 /DNA_START=65 /DNA_END=829 /DNA_ORIENTATION=+
MSSREEAPGTEGQTGHKAFIGGLNFNMNSEDLKRAFDRYDAISAEVMVDKHTGRSRGFGFVYFKDERGQADAIENIHNQELDGRRVSVVKAVPQDQTRPGTPAAALGAGPGARKDGVTRRDPYPPRGGGGGYERGYDRYAGGGGGGGGYERGGGGGYERGYGGYADPRYAAYERGGYDRVSGGYGAYGGYGGGGYGGGYDDRSAGYGYSDYGRGGSGYDDRGAGGPERRGYGGSSRAGPYDRAPETRRSPDGRR